MLRAGAMTGLADLPAGYPRRAYAQYLSMERVAELLADRVVTFRAGAVTHKGGLGGIGRHGPSWTEENS